MAVKDETKESTGKRKNEVRKDGDSIKTGVPGCDGYAIVNGDGELQGCYATQAAAEAAMAADNTEDMGDMQMTEKYSDRDLRIMANRGQAMQSGSFPILDAEDMDKAIGLFTKAQAHPGSRAMRHIMQRAVDLNMQDKIPVEWGLNKSIGASEEELVRKAHAAGVASLQKNATGTIISSSALDKPLSI
jgi:hypothetical protein